MFKHVDNKNYSKMDKIVGYFNKNKIDDILLSENTNKNKKEHFISADYFLIYENIARSITASIFVISLVMCFIFGGLIGIGGTLISKLIMVISITLVAYFIMLIWSSSKKKEALKKVSMGVPFAIDLMAISVQSGLSIENTIIYVAKEINYDFPLLSTILKKVHERANLVGLKVALSELQEGVDISEVRSLSYTLSQGIKFGSSIHHVLLNLSSDMRALRLLSVEEKIGSLASKMSVPLILFILMPVVVLVVAPGLLRLMEP